MSLYNGNSTCLSGDVRFLPWVFRYACPSEQMKR